MHAAPAKTFHRQRRLQLIFISIVLLAAAAAWQARRVLADPNVILLTPRDGSKWIQFNRPFSLYVWHSNEINRTLFRKDFNSPADFAGDILHLRALHQVEVFLDGKRLFDTGPQVINWKATYNIPLPASLIPGPHRLELKVTNPNGPCLAWLYAPSLHLHSDASWRASRDGLRYTPAALADAPKEPELEFEFPTCVSAIAATVPLLTVLFAIGFVAAFYVQQKRNARDWIRWLRWGVLLAWVFIASNNLFKLPFYIGYDVVDHGKYIHFIVEKHRVPLPNEGWEFFQTPFYYLVSAVFFRAMQWADIAVDNADQFLRIIPLLCCIGIVEVCYRSAKLIFPNRRDLQAIALLAAGFLPMLLYMAPSLSNQPMAGLLDSFIVLFSLGLLVDPAKPISLPKELLCGVLLGLAVLTKVTAIVWIPPLFFALAITFYHQRAGILRLLRCVTIVLVVAAAITSWYFIRNWIEIGHPFFLGSRIGDYIALQDPGFRTPYQFLEFGRMFARPVYSGLNSVWDSLYATTWADGFISGQGTFKFRPPWDFRLMACGMWLSVFPMAAFLAGVIRSIVLTLHWIFKPDIETQPHSPNPLAPFWFAMLGISCYLGAIAHEYLMNPMYSYGKASYMLGAAPCFAILAAAGFNLLPKHGIIRSTAAGLLFCWAATAYLTYWIV